MDAVLTELEDEGNVMHADLVHQAIDDATELYRAAVQQSFDTPVLAGSHTFYMDEGAVFGVRGTLKF